VIRRHPDIRWLRRAADVEHLVATQRAMLDALWPLLEPGGILVYATCSVLVAENAGQIQSFLERHADARVIEHPELPGRAASPAASCCPVTRIATAFFVLLLAACTSERGSRLAHRPGRAAPGS
jgi:16S rRNA (cytosine967-C5)-methyltransferase